MRESLRPDINKDKLKPNSEVVRLLCERVIVMRAGAILEQGPTDRVLFAPQAQYTRDLLAAIPRPPV